MITKEQIYEWSGLGPLNMAGWVFCHLAENNEKFTLIYSDCAERIGIADLKERFPETCVEAGIAEQNQMCIAAAMANEGFCVFSAAYTPFITGRILDQIKVTMGYMKSPVKLIGLNSGLAGGDLGATHVALEDLADMRAVPNLVVVSPADCTEIMKVFLAAANLNAPVYIRLTSWKNPQIVYHSDYDFKIGKAVTLKSGHDIALIAAGSIVFQTLKAAENLEKEGISCEVINMHTIKPLDTEKLASLASYESIYTIEEHSIIGGLGGAVAEFLSERKGMPSLRRIGVNDFYCPADTHEALLDQCGLTTDKITKRILSDLK